MELWCYLHSCGDFLWTCLYISEQFGQVELPLLTEAGELQQETDRVIRLVQTRQALHCSHCIQTLSRREKVNMKISNTIVNKKNNNIHITSTVVNAGVWTLPAYMYNS